MLQDILQSEDYSSIPSSIRIKLESFINKQEHKQKYAEALYKTCIEEKEYITQQLKNEKNNNKTVDIALHTERDNIIQLEKQLSLLCNENRGLKDVIAKHEQETTCLVTKCDNLYNENVSLKVKLAKRDNELELLNDDFNSISNNLKSILQDKIKIALELEGIKSKENSLKLRETDLEHKEKYYIEQIDTMKKKFQNCNSELICIERQRVNDIGELHEQIAIKQTQIDVLSRSEKTYKDAVTKLSVRTDELNSLLSESYEEIQNIHSNYTQQLDTQTTRADVYKEMYEASERKAKDLETVSIELNRHLSESKSNYEKLIEEYELKLVSVEESLKQEVTDLKQKLSCAEKHIKEITEENTCKGLQTFSSNAAQSYKMYKHDSVNHMSQDYYRICDQLTLVTKEKEQLVTEFEEFSQGVESQMAVIQKRHQDYEHLLITVQKMGEAYDKIETEYSTLKGQYAEADRRSSFLSRENERMKISINDLTKQVQCLLKEVECVRGGYTDTITSPIKSDVQTSDEVISNRLVTFRNINELQTRNQELLIVVRELSASYDDSQNPDNYRNKRILEDKIENVEKSLLEKTQDNEYLNRVIMMLKHKVNLFKRLYQQQIPRHNISKLTQSSSLALKDSNQHINNAEDDVDFVNVCVQTDLDIASINTLTNDLESLKEDLKNTKNHYEQLKQEHFNRDNDSSSSEMKKKLNQMYSDYNVLFARAQKFDELNKSDNLSRDILKRIECTFDKNLNVYQNKVEEYKKLYASLKSESLKDRQKIEVLENKLSDIENECTRLRENEFNNNAEKASLLRERENQEKLLVNLEDIKMNIDRSNAEWKSRFEKKFDFTFEECCMLQRRLQDEQNKFQNKIDYLSNTLNKTEICLQEMRKENVTFKRTIDELKKEIQQKDEALKTINEQSKPEPIEVDCNILEFEIAYLKKEISDKNNELATVKEQLIIANNDFESAISLSGDVQKRLTEEHQNEMRYKKETDEKLSKLTTELTDMKRQNAKLNENISELLTSNENSKIALNQELEDTKRKHLETIKKLSNLNEQINSCEAKIREDNLFLLITQKKYTSEMLSHTEDLKKLDIQSNRITELEQQIVNLNTEKHAALEKIASSNTEWTEKYECMKKELEQQTERLNLIIGENDALLKQTVELVSQLNSLPTKSEIDLNKSSSPTSLVDKESGGENYIKLLSNLTKEKKLLLSKLDTLDADNSRMASELEATKQKLKEADVFLEMERNKSEQNSATVANSAAIMRKIQTLDIMLDSNELLRNERNSLKGELTTFKKMLEDIEQKELQPLINENETLTQRLNNTINENVSLRKECTRWRNRAQELTDKLETYNLDEIMKSLSLEKEKRNETLDELCAVKQKKIYAEEQVNKLTERISSLEREQIETQKQLEKEKSDYEIIKVELNDLKKTYEAQESVTKEMKTSNMQLRMIAKKYKTQYTELMKVTETEVKNSNNSVTLFNSSLPTNIVDGGVSGSNGAGGILIDEQERLRQKVKQQIETDFSERIQKLNEQIVIRDNEIDMLKKEQKAMNDSMTEQQSRSRELIKRAHSRIMTLSNSLKETRLKMNRYKTDLASQKLQSETCENRIRELEADKVQLQTERDRQMKEIETLTQKIAMIQRQLTSYQNTRPSVSVVQEKSTSEPPPTANIKPMAGSSSSSSKLQNSQQSVTVLPWKSTTSNETPCASIRPRSVQTRTATVLRTSQSSSHTTPRLVAVLVPPRQQLVSTSTGSAGFADALSSVPSSSSHIDYSVPSTRHMIVTPTQQISQSVESAQMITPLVSPLQTPPTVAFVAPRIEPQNQSVQTQTQTAENVEQQQQQVIVASSQSIEQFSGNDRIIQEVSHESVYHVHDDDSNQELIGSASGSINDDISHEEEVGNVDRQQEEQQSVEITPVIITANQNSGSCFSILLATSSSASISSNDMEGQQSVTESVRTVSSSNNSNNNNHNTVTTTRANLKRKRQSLDTEEASGSSRNDESVTSQQMHKRICPVELFDIFDDSLDGAPESRHMNELDVEYEVSTSFQGEQEFENVLMIDSEIDYEVENSQAMPDEGIIVGISNQDLDMSDNVDGFLDQDDNEGSYSIIDESDIDAYNAQDQNNEAEIRNDIAGIEVNQQNEVEEAGQSTDGQAELNFPSTSVSQPAATSQQFVPQSEEIIEVSLDDALEEEQIDTNEIEELDVNSADQRDNDCLNNTLDDSIAEES